jgi:hypothetical protein
MDIGRLGLALHPVEVASPPEVPKNLALRLELPLSEPLHRKSRHCQPTKDSQRHKKRAPCNDIARSQQKI